MTMRHSASTPRLNTTLTELTIEGYTTARLQERLMIKRAALSVIVLTVFVASCPTIAQRPAAAQPAARAAAAAYFPDRFDWQHKKPEEVGMNPALVNEAVQLAI